MTEQQWERKLNIHTIGRDDSYEDAHHFPYEPTPYPVLERLLENGFLGNDSILVDYGCGKGRVGFFLSYALGIPTIGIEAEERIYQQALANKKSCRNSIQADFVHMPAEYYTVSDATDFYFFNPFPVTTLKSVLGRIMMSYYENPRTMHLYFYYPNDEYVAYLMTVPELTFVDEIDCSDLFDITDSRENILIFRI